jgi:hypothetical protein
MAETKTGALPIPKFGAAAAGAKPMAPNVPLNKAATQFMPPPKTPPKRKLAFRKGVTAFGPPKE